MARVLRVALSDVEQLHVGRVALHVVLEQVGVVVQVPLVERQAHLLVHALQHGAALRHHRNREGLLGHDAGGKRAQLRLIHALRHPVVHHGGELGQLLTGQPGVRLEQEAAGHLESRHLVESARASDGHGVCAQCGGKVHARPHLHHLRPGAGGELAASRQPLGLKRLLQQPLQGRAIVLGEVTGELDVEALLRLYRRHPRDGFLHLVQERRQRRVPQHGRAVPLAHSRLRRLRARCGPLCNGCFHVASAARSPGTPNLTNRS
mmetsp:Transcript_37183/g.71306  ORF Transcript_37183/g.71306 Transcript_37183/m.71306 type:complete len:263 (+) Transcript_37183:3538-4326(+)